MKIVNIEDLINEYRGGVYAKKIIIEAEKDKILPLRNLLYTTVKAYAVDTVLLIRNDNDTTFKTCDLAAEIGKMPIIHERLDKKYRYDKVYYCNLQKTCEGDFLDIFSEDIELVNINKEPVGIKPFMENFRLTQLTKGQTIDLDFYIVKDNGTSHMKYQPGFLTRMVKDKNTKLYEVIIESYGHYSADKLLHKLFKDYEREVGVINYPKNM